MEYYHLPNVHKESSDNIPDLTIFIKIECSTTIQIQHISTRLPLYSLFQNIHFDEDTLTFVVGFCLMSNTYSINYIKV